MINGNSEEITKLVEPGRVHRRVYSDADVFELEMERIFGRAWLFVGHTSQVPNPGDYITTELGRQPEQRPIALANHLRSPRLLDRGVRDVEMEYRVQTKRPAYLHAHWTAPFRSQFD